MRKLNQSINVDNSDPTNYPNGRIKNNTGTGNGTPVNELVYGDIHQTKDRLLDLYGIIANDLPDNITNGFQLIEALSALASKNDFILPLSLNSGFLSIPIKLGFMLENEQVVCKAGFNLSNETQIKGSDNTTYSLSVSGLFKSNEYVRLIKTASGVTIIRLADDISLNDMVNALLYLKKATQPEEDAGIIDTKATTPLSNLMAFAKRVNGTDSNLFLATLIRDGLYPKEHFAIVADLVNSPVKNVGWFSGLNVAGSGSLSVNGNITAATLTSSGPDSFVTCTMQNAMVGLNYYVRAFIQGEGASLDFDNDITQIIFKPLSTTQFQISVREITENSQSLKIHLEVVQL